MCKNQREVTLKEVAINNTKLLNEVIKFINAKINVDLYEIKHSNNSNNSNNSSNSSNIELANKKNKSFYKQTIKRLLNLVERFSMKERLLLEEVEKGQKILTMKKALTVKSPSMSSEVFAASLGNSQEQILIDIGEETEKQKQRIKKYEAFVSEHEKEKVLIREFIELSPNTPGVEAIIRHFIEGQPFREIADVMSYEQVYTIWKRALDDLAVILMFDL